jgi:hypothetical protein
MPGAESDLIYFQAGVKVLEAYLLSQELYWSVQVNLPKGEAPAPSLTLGGILLAQLRLNSHVLPDHLKVERDVVELELDRLRTRWRVAWEKKASREFHARLNLWRDFLEEYRASPASHTDRYRYEVSRRVMLDLLLPYSTEMPPAEKEMFVGLDRVLQAVFLPGEFIWDQELASAFPPRPFWYLYGRLR